MLDQLLILKRLIKESKYWIIPDEDGNDYTRSYDGYYNLSVCKKYIKQKIIMCMNIVKKIMIGYYLLSRIRVYYIIVIMMKLKKVK